MRFRSRETLLSGLGCAAAVCMAAWIGSVGVKAQQQERQAPAGERTGQQSTSVILPTGDQASGVLRMDVQSPSEVPVGRSYEYQVTVSNVSENQTLEDVTVTQTSADGFSIEQAEPEAESGENGQTSFKVGTLHPGESKTISITGLQDNEDGKIGCLTADYKPAICLAGMVKFVKPQIQVVKEAPEQANICQPVDIRYTVKNTGSGVARNVVVTDNLPDGLILAQGQQQQQEEVRDREEGDREEGDREEGDRQNQVTFNAGDLQADESKSFTVRAIAEEVGTYGSRASAKGEEDLQARSNQVSTEFIGSELDIAIQGPSTQYYDRPATYQVRVNNTGDAPAMNTQLQIQVDEQARILRVSKSAPAEATPDAEGNTLSWNLGDIDPDQEHVVSFTINARQKADMKHVAQATSLCAREEGVAQAVVEANTAETSIATSVLTFPALVLEMVDLEDPISAGQETVYRIVVRNQGSGPDNDVQISMDLPDQFEFVEASGSTEVEAEGNKLTFASVETLEPNQRVTWDVRVLAKEPGDVRNRADLTSEYLGDDPVSSEEPTRIIGPDSEPNKEKEDQDPNDDDDDDDDNDDNDS